METKKLWNKVDPRDAQLMAMATELKELKSQQTKATALASASNTGRRTDDPFIDGLPRWRTVKKGDTMIVDGRTYYWCPHHKHAEGYWNGLYCTHLPSRCFKNPAHNKSGKPGNDKSGKEKSSNQSAKLELHAKLKEVMCTNLCLSSEDVDRIFDQASASSN